MVHFRQWRRNILKISQSANWQSREALPSRRAYVIADNQDLFETKKEKNKLPPTLDNYIRVIIHI